MANTVWNVADKTASCNLTGGNLIATGGAAGTNSVRAVDKQADGKFYWECTYTVNAGAGTAAGAMASASAFGSSIGAGGGPAGSFGLNHVGTVYVDGVSALGGFGTIANGTVVCFAVDASARLLWVRVAAAGNWNLSASANPATGAGGLAIGLGRGIPFHPACSLTGTGEQITANFGDTAFTGTPPSGYTAGFTAGASIGTNALATQALAEHWFTTSPDARVTSVVVEHWASVEEGPPPVEPGAGNNVRVMVIA